ncbi:uncharacterized protein CIMG_08291 [Coccidioides immitis RS]|uniref:Uncharacterized protein n=3 Tax=Coccidioides immitis TaxID=5501 RepID=J3K569_COCIM|nr:uncharacterized protein CIMG_08291 [Coccidioides immitis RS]EAS29545.3 hypothetical protein CIMG_08291 [Coccidioides immitis RS]KMP02544.1 hypothetical protein CIRG_10380 [Coccidioides immitis RMSCC 2394]KMU73695.1 hypothetical protein CISG_03745 [Coccidioides immitis RMSCC 3703]TPX22446.1 hypothetical protein DIZ76_014318 [Coccidioides immitis]
MPATSTPPKTPASKLASSISKSRQVLPDPTNSFKPGARQSSPTVRNFDQITRIGAQRSMPAQSRQQAAAQDIRNSKPYKSFARRWTATIVALPILLYTSYALYERVFYDKEPRSLPGVNAFPQPESSNQPSDFMPQSATSNDSSTP